MSIHEIKKKKNFKSTRRSTALSKNQKRKRKRKIVEKRNKHKKKGKKMIISEKTKIANDEHIKKIIIINKRMIRSEKMKNQRQKRQINIYKKFELA